MAIQKTINMIYNMECGITIVKKSLLTANKSTIEDFTYIFPVFNWKLCVTIAKHDLTFCNQNHDVHSSPRSRLI